MGDNPISSIVPYNVHSLDHPLPEDILLNRVVDNGQDRNAQGGDTYKYSPSTVGSAYLVEVNGIVDNDHQGAAQIGKLDRNDVMVVQIGNTERRTTVDQFVNDNEFRGFGTPEQRNEIVIRTAKDAGGAFSANARRFAKSGKTFVKDS